MDFPRYLSAKKTVDDRAINRYVWDQLLVVLSATDQGQPLRILEVGCGIGTMVERLLEWGLADRVKYLGIDSQAENIRVAHTRLASWGAEHGYQIGGNHTIMELQKQDLHWQVQFQETDATSFWKDSAYWGNFDLLVAQAFLDLVDVPSALPSLARLVLPGGHFYFTLNFDGSTILEPVLDNAYEAQIISHYHQTMDDRRVNGLPSGDSCTGRHLFHHLQAAGAHILAVGASDWVVYPGAKGYLADEAFFLQCILDFIESSLGGHPNLDRDVFTNWIADRRLQIQHGELIYIAHQLDFLGSFSPDKTSLSS